MPDAIRIAAPAPACIAAPAGATGSTADADEAQTNASASAKSVPRPSAASRTKTPSARSTHDAATPSPGPRGLARRRRVLSDPAGEPEAREQPEPREPRQRQHDGRRRDTRDGDDDQPSCGSSRRRARPRRDRGERREGDAVEQAEQEKRERDGAESSPAGAGSGARRPTRTTSSQRPGSAIPPTDAAPPAAASVSMAGRCPLRRAAASPTPSRRRRAGDHAGEPDEPEVRVMERPARRCEVAHDEQPPPREPRRTKPDIQDALARAHYRVIGRCALRLSASSPARGSRSLAEPAEAPASARWGSPRPCSRRPGRSAGASAGTGRRGAPGRDCLRGSPGTRCRSPSPGPLRRGSPPAAAPRPSGSPTASRPRPCRIAACLIALGLQDRGALLAVGAHLLLHRVLDRGRRIDRLQLDAVDADAPLPGRIVEDAAQLVVDRSRAR